MHLPPGGIVIERITDCVAMLAVISWLTPRFYQTLSDYSQLAALLLPILGCAWLAVQIIVRISRGN